MANPTPKSVIHHNPEELDNMRILKKKRYAIPAVVAATVLAVTGSAFAYFTSSGAGTGSAPVGTASNLVIRQLGTPVYDSTIAPIPGSLPSYGAEAYAFNEIGNEVTLASPAAPLSNVVVTMESWTCGNYLTGSTPCITTPGTSYPQSITLYLYQAATAGIPGALIASDTETFNIPFRPSSAPSSAGCADSTEWLDNAATAAAYGVTADNLCHHGLANNITFNFSSQGVVLPSTVVYGISYNTDHYGPQPTKGSSNPADSLNVAFTTASANVSVGSDTVPGDIFINDGYATNGNIFCGTITADTFMAANDDCSGVSGTPPTYDIPAVQFNVNSMSNLYPDNTAHLINFSVTNPGVGNVYVNGVTIAISSITQTAASVAAYGADSCNPSWFSFVQPTAPVNTELVPGTTDYSGDASITMIDESGNQDACEGATVNLAFTSN
jgi:hypothetical protein